ncbi:hypothetical protein ACFLU6_02985 [Acidobacteriota bacterium]
MARRGSNHHPNPIWEAGCIPFTVAILETEEPPLYQQIAQQAALLCRLGISVNRIAWKLKVNRQTISKALLWSKSMLALR